MSIDPALFSSACTTWVTPAAFFARVAVRFGPFTLDAAASAENAKAPKFYTEATNGLAQSWEGESVWCNHPYGRQFSRQWQQKCHKESSLAASVTMLCPARTDTRAFHELVLPTANVIVFVKGRLEFEGAKDPAPFPSMLVHWNGGDSLQIETMHA